jgi:hypothetical protein
MYTKIFNSSVQVMLVLVILNYSFSNCNLSSIGMCSKPSYNPVHTLETRQLLLSLM